jgi:hypothetical protein
LTDPTIGSRKVSTLSDNEDSHHCGGVGPRPSAALAK